MAGIDSPVARYLRSQSRWLGEAWVAGTLYDLGRYPGLSLSGDTKVVGHLFELTDPVTSLPVLDQYEGVGTDFEQPAEYRRETIAVTFKSKRVTVWTYLYNWPTEGKHRIPSGNYLYYLSQNPDFQQFIQSLTDLTRHE